MVFFHRYDGGPVRECYFFIGVTEVDVDVVDVVDVIDVVVVVVDVEPDVDSFLRNR